MQNTLSISVIFTSRAEYESFMVLQQRVSWISLLLFRPIFPSFAFEYSVVFCKVQKQRRFIKQAYFFRFSMKILPSEKTNVFFVDLQK